MGQLQVNGKGDKPYALVDDEFFPFLSRFNWSWTSRGYVKTCIDGRAVKLHRLVLNAPHGTAVDHINQDKSDNQLANLRLCSHSGNMANRIYPPPASGYRGVKKSRRQWEASISINGKKTYLGIYSTPELAAHAYNASAKEYHGDYTVLNVVDPT